MYAINVTYASSRRRRHCGYSHSHSHSPGYDHDCDHPAALARATTVRRIGFRHVALVTVNDTDPAVAKQAAAADGTGGLTMFFRVNGAAVYARGANKVPMDLLEGRYSASSIRRLVQSAAEANFNTLRVWGGGVYEPRTFYDACDDFGILLYHDLMFTWGSVDASINVTGTNSSAIARVELNHQLKRLSHHPSIVMWSACNECGGGGGSYDQIIMPIVASIGCSRPVLPVLPFSPTTPSAKSSPTLLESPHTPIRWCAGDAQQYRLGAVLDCWHRPRFLILLPFFCFFWPHLCSSRRLTY